MNIFDLVLVTCRGAQNQRPFIISDILLSKLTSRSSLGLILIRLHRYGNILRSVNLLCKLGLKGGTEFN